MHSFHASIFHYILKLLHFHLGIFIFPEFQWIFWRTIKSESLVSFISFTIPISLPLFSVGVASSSSLQYLWKNFGFWVGIGIGIGIMVLLFFSSWVTGTRPGVRATWRSSIFFPYFLKNIHVYYFFLSFDLFLFYFLSFLSFFLSFSDLYFLFLYY